MLSSMLLLTIAAAVAGCRAPELNPTPPTAENQVLSDYLQLTHGFARAGEAYFSRDMKWIIFQASTKPDEDYQMHLAQIKWEGDRIAGINAPIRITPSPSWNSCGFFSPDGNSIIFSSTALNPVPREEAGGYQRDKRNYRWSMPATAEIFRADGWKAAVSALPPGGSVNLARFPITHNDVHDAECSYSPDGKWIVYASRVDDLPLPVAPVPAGELLKTSPATAPSVPRPNIELFVMKPDGSQRTRLTRMPGYDGGPFFSPDGKRLVYRSDRKGNDLLQIYTADIVFDKNGDITGLANERQLTHDVNVNWGPYWHPDGKHLIWATSIHGHQNYELYLMRDDGTRKTRITFTPGADVLPVFSPDGRWLMWTTNRGAERIPDPRDPSQTIPVSEIWVARFGMPKGT
jgi:Tol biopolymer transport system component